MRNFSGGDAGAFVLYFYLEHARTDFTTED